MTTKSEECSKTKIPASQRKNVTHRDSVPADEARQAACAVPDRELCAILNIRARLL